MSLIFCFGSSNLTERFGWPHGKSIFKSTLCGVPGILHCKTYYYFGHVEISSGTIAIFQKILSFISVQDEPSFCNNQRTLVCLLALHIEFSVQGFVVGVSANSF